MYEPIIGLEVHLELKTLSKMFCGCSADYFGHEPNTHCCPVCLGLPGALPVANKKAVEWCILLGLALNCKVNKQSYFERKNYFYPDLPKGYQISQYSRPLTHGGYLELGEKKIRINRVHMEEDTGKLIHAVVNGEKVSLIDFNRSGVPLIEIVTEPDFRSSDEVVTFLKKLQQIIRYSGISDADMEKGSMRLEPNISIKVKSTSEKSEVADKLPNYRIELKNINSFRFVKKAIEHEIKRQIELLSRGKKLGFETRGWDEKREVTFGQRTKEEAHDYRYFPEPDIPPMEFGELQITNYKLQLPELPDAKIERFRKQYGLSEYDATIICETREKADYYEGCIKVLKYQSIMEITPKVVANWLINKKIEYNKVAPEELVKLIVNSVTTAKISDEELEKIVKKVIEENPKAVADYKSGKEQALMFLIGQVMRKVRGPGNNKKIKEMLEELLVK